MDPLSSPPHHKPRLRKLLAALSLDIEYLRGQGELLFYEDRHGQPVEVLDLVGGYGTTLLGHSHPDLIARMRESLERGLPFSAQGSRNVHAEQLAKQLSERAHGDYCCVFTNSGAESVEAALKHALLETKGRTIIAVEGAFHGKTLGAVQAIGNPAYREPFELNGLRVVHVPRNDVAALTNAFQQVTDIACFIYEPILGEAGVRPLSAEFIRTAAELCHSVSAPLIADECQTGCGRTGHWLASQTWDVSPDYILLSKALGGGLGKIGATLIRRERYREEFDWLQTGTFAADPPTCAIALEVLRLIDQSHLQRISQLGQSFRDTLQEIAVEFPDVIREVRGRGLMWGVEFQPQHSSNSFALRVLTSQDQLLHLVAAYLMRRHRIRVLPTLSDPWTLRLQPPSCTRDSQWNRWIMALRDVCRKLQAGDWPGLSDFLLEHTTANLTEAVRWHDSPRICAFDEHRGEEIHKPSAARRVAWLCHLIDVDDLTLQEPRLRDRPFAVRERLLERFTPLACPVVMNGVDVQSRTGQTVRLYPILLPFSSRIARHWSHTRETCLPRTLIHEGLNIASQLGCSVVSLGQYNSILTRDGLALIDDVDRATDASPLWVSSGNSYTVALAVDAVERSLAERGLVAERCTLAIAGALGNIGSICAQILAPRFQQTLLLGSNRRGVRRRLSEFASQLPRTHVIDQPTQMIDANVVVSAVSSATSTFEVEHFGRGAVVCDISVPSSVRRTDLDTRPDLHIFRGGIAQLPGNEDLGIASYPLAVGQVFGCLAEAILLGSDATLAEHFAGPVTIERVNRTAVLAERFGMTLGELKLDCVLGSDVLEAAYDEP